MNNENLEILNFETGKYGPTNENLNDYETSIFKKIYDEAFKSLEEILIHENELDNNNIISFVGERGSGKTSCMISFENILLDAIKQKSDILKDKNISKYHFETLDIIDPSFFTTTSNVLEIIIATLFQNFKEKSNKDKNLEDQRRILLQFKKVYQTISIIENKYDFDGENYNKLLDLSASMTLKKDINDLISNYLDFITDKNEKSKLIIKIDDIDLNIRYSYEMVEQIRKYLMQKNIIILIAVKLEQLEQIIKVNYIDDFKENITNLDYEKMSYRYLEKLIPQNRRMFLLNLEKELKKINIKLFENTGSVEKELRELLYKKIKILFTDDKVKNNPIIPKNLRELINFINTFYNLTTIESNSSMKNELFKENILKFDNYFFNAWIEDNLTKQNKDILRELHTKVPGEKNKYIITKILEKLNGKDREKNKKLENINNYKFISTNISLGDVLETLSDLKRVIVDNESENFIIAIKILYSRYIYEYYLDYKSDKKLNSLEYTDYEILIGGEIIISKNILYAPEHFENINSDIFYQELKDIFNRYETIVENINNINSTSSINNKVLLDTVKNDLKKIEFLVFLTYFFKDVHGTTKRISGDVADNKKLGKVRDDAFYNGIYDLNVKSLRSVEFDLFSPFFFSLSEYRLLSRYVYKNSNLYELVDSINKLINEDSKFEKININFFNGIYFRNIEIIEKIFNKLISVSSSDKFEVIKKTYDRLGKFKIQTDILPINNSRKYKALLDYFNDELVKDYFNKIIFSSLTLLRQDTIELKNKINALLEETSKRSGKTIGVEIIQNIEINNSTLKEKLNIFIEENEKNTKNKFKENIKIFFADILEDKND